MLCAISNRSSEAASLLITGRFESTTCLMIVLLMRICSSPAAWRVFQPTGSRSPASFLRMMNPRSALVNSSSKKSKILVSTWLRSTDSLSAWVILVSAISFCSAVAWLWTRLWCDGISSCDITLGSWETNSSKKMELRCLPAVGAAERRVALLLACWLRSVPVSSKENDRVESQILIWAWSKIRVGLMIASPLRTVPLRLFKSCM